jgi:hypothetical protein
MVGKERDFHALLPRSRRRVLAGTPLSVLDLATQIAVKEELGFAKDRAVVSILKATLEARRKRK